MRPVAIRYIGSLARFRCSVLSVPFARGGAALELLEQVHEAGFEIWGLSPRGSTDIRDVPKINRIALVTGTEGEGLPAHIMQRFQNGAHFTDASAG